MTMTDTPRTFPWRTLLFFLRDVVVIFAIAIVVSFVVKTFLVRSFYIPSSSMEQTLEINDRIIVSELVPKLVSLEHGDVVVFRDPGGWVMATTEPDMNPVQAGIEWTLSLFGLVAPDSDEHLVKRVIGLPGDTVACCTTDGKVTVNGVPLTEPYINLPEGQIRASAIDFEKYVEPGTIFVMGDNRYNSKDSRYNTDLPGGGLVPIEKIVGRAILVSWPMEHWGWLSNYPETFKDVPASGY